MNRTANSVPKLFPSHFMSQLLFLKTKVTQHMQIVIILCVNGFHAYNDQQNNYSSTVPDNLTDKITGVRCHNWNHPFSTCFG